MRVVVNNINVLVDFVEVKVSIDKLTRQFTIKDVSNSSTFKMGDDVSIYDNDTLIISANIEYVEIGQERTFIYAGRNATKYIVDSYAKSTIQFSAGQDLAEILSVIAEPFGISVTGSASIPSDITSAILVGDSLGEFAMKLAKYSGVILTSDAIGGLHIEEPSLVGEARLKYGDNIRKREYREDATIIYDSYVFVSQNSYRKNGGLDVNVRGSFSAHDEYKSKTIKVVRANSNLTVHDCNVLAESEHKKDMRKSLFYKVEVDRSLGIQVNHVYSVIDDVANIDYRMRAKEVVLTLDSNTDKSTVTFERI